VTALFLIVIVDTAGVSQTLAQATPTPPTAITILTPDKRIFGGRCNTFTVQAPPTTAWREFAGHVSSTSQLLSIWKYDNASQRYFGVYFADANAPTDGPAMTGTYGYTFAIWVCTVGDGTIA
jgi:hypothetical protein